MKILIDNGHGVDTKGKRSPDSSFFEWEFARVISKQIVEQLVQKGFDCQLLVPEDQDISLKERCRRTNEIAKNSKVILISIHANAAGDGSQWMKGTGWEAWTSRGNTKSDLLAECLYKKAEQIFIGDKIRKDPSDGDSDKESGFYILKNTVCPAVLTENFFYDNKEEVEMLKTPAKQAQIVQVHVEGIIEYLNLQNEK